MTSSNTTALPPIPPVHDIHASRPGKDKYLNGSIPVRLNLSSRELDELRSNPEVQRRMGRYGYNDLKISNFWEVFQQALAANNRQVKEFGEKTAAYAEFEKMFSKVKADFSIIKKIAKIALRNQPLKTDQLGLGRKFGRDIPSIFSAMQMFYNNEWMIDYYTIAKFALARNSEFEEEPSNQQ